jgi:Chaperone of endosialidase
LGIGTTTPYSRFTVWGNDTASTSPFAVVNSASTTVFAVYDNGNATYSGSIFHSSDQRLKTDITSLDASSSLAALEALNPVSYTPIDQNDGQNLGFIAQQVAPIFPELVSTT